MTMSRWSAFGGRICGVVVQEVMRSKAWWETQTLLGRVHLWVQVSYIGTPEGRARSMS